MTTSLVTVAAGFIGSTLAETLIASGDTVIGMDSFLDYYDRTLKEKNLAKLRESDRFELVEGSIQDQDLETLLRRCDRLFHLAAQAGVRASWGTEFSIYTTNNILATQKLLEAAISSELASFVFAESFYCDRVDGGIEEPVGDAESGAEECEATRFEPRHTGNDDDIAEQR